MKIAIDARSLTTRPTGVGHYLLAAVNVCAQADPGVEFLLLAHREMHPQAAAALRPAANVRFVVCPFPAVPGRGLLWLLFGYAPAARRLGATVLWGASGVLPLFGCAGLCCWLTVHDLVFRTLPQTMSWRSRIGYGLLAGQAIRRTDRLWAVSRYTASEIERHYPRRRAAAIAIGSGINPLRVALDVSATGPAAASDALMAQAQGPTLLFVGTVEPRKNLAFLLSLMPELGAKGFRLLVVGGKGWGGAADTGQAGAPAMPASTVTFLDYVSDEQLQMLYRQVGLFVSPSLMEGYGLPQLEAMAAGCAVVAAANSAVVEIVGDGGVLVAGWSPAAWVSAIEKVWRERDLWRARARARAAAVSAPDAPGSMLAAWRSLRGVAA